MNQSGYGFRGGQKNRQQQSTSMMHKRRRKSLLRKLLHKAKEAGEAACVRLGLYLIRESKDEHRARAIDALLSTPVVTQTKHGPIRFLNHGIGSCKRARRLLFKEPDSLKWIDAMERGSVFWDIGANIGTLSLYAAARGDLDVWAFEPAAVNYYNLCANCELNDFTNRMHCLQMGFGGANEIADLKVSQLAPAQSFSFKEGKPFNSHQASLVLTIDEFIAHYAPQFPNYVKIDVPGLTWQILEGAQTCLQNPRLKQIQIEVDQHGRQGRRVIAFLGQFGFAIVVRNMKRHGTVQGDLVFGR